MSLHSSSSRAKSIRWFLKSWTWPSAIGKSEQGKERNVTYVSNTHNPAQDFSVSSHWSLLLLLPLCACGMCQWLVVERMFVARLNQGLKACTNAKIFTFQIRKQKNNWILLHSVDRSIWQGKEEIGKTLTSGSFAPMIYISKYSIWTFGDLE